MIPVPEQWHEAGDRDADGDIHTRATFLCTHKCQLSTCPALATLTLGKVAAGIPLNDPNSHFTPALANASTTYGCTSTYINSFTFMNFIYIYVFKKLYVFKFYINIQYNLWLILVLLQMFVYPQVCIDTTYVSIRQYLY